MKALGRQFSIGTLYNYSEDVIIPSKIHSQVLTTAPTAPTKIQIFFFFFRNTTLGFE